MSKSSNFVGGRAALCVFASVALGISVSAEANEIQVAFDVPVGGTSLPMLVEGLNTPVSITCASNTAGYRGVGQVTMLRPNPPQFLEWVGLDIATGAITSGYSGTVGAHIIYCSFTDEYVEMQVYSRTQIQIKNNGPVPVSGIVNFIW